MEILRGKKSRTQRTQSDVQDFRLIARVGKQEYKIILQNFRRKT